MTSETGPVDAMTVQLGALSAKVDAVDAGLADVRRAILQIRQAAASEHEILRNLDGLDVKVAELTECVLNLAPPVPGETDDYLPASTTRWWQIDDDEREEAITRLQFWVSKIFVPGYGYLAKLLPACWPQHELALYSLSWLMELWSSLYLKAEPSASTLAAMAELQTRLIPATLEQLAKDARDCVHGGNGGGAR